MTVIQAFLLGLLYFFGGCGAFCGFVTTQRPVLGGFLVGLIFGKPVEGAIMGATINLIYIGAMSVGGSTPSDANMAGIVGTGLYLSTGCDMETALALAVPLAMLGSMLNVINMTGCCSFVRISEKWIEEGKEHKQVIACVVLPFILKFFTMVVPVFVFCYFGDAVLVALSDFLGGWILSALKVVGGMLPAVGIALTLNAIYKGGAKVYLFIGFALATYLKVPTMGLALIGVCLAILANRAQAKNNA